MRNEITALFVCTLGTGQQLAVVTGEWHHWTIGSLL